jgi:alkylation response protein AidB-like acyl-CoA dehydrogenase
MDFSFTEDQQQIAALAGKIFAERASHERQRGLERAGGPRFDRELWRALAEAGLVGLALPEAQGGGGMGFLELALVLQEAGRRTAPVPLLETALLGALPVAAFGSAAQKQAILPRVAAGELVMTAALHEEGGDAARPETTASPAEDGGWRLSGRKLCVPAGAIADRILVPAATGPGSVGVFLVDPATPGVVRESVQTTNAQPDAHLVFDAASVPADAVLGDPRGGARVVAWLEPRATAGLCALALGVCEEALRLTAEYAKTRKQFDQPIAMFQAVGHRAANAYIDTEGIRLTSWQASWRIAAGLPAEAAVAVAKIWAAEAGQRVVHAAQHLHGGVGVDREYPLHRYFLWAKQLELSLGGATRQLLRLGRLLADTAA